MLLSGRSWESCKLVENLRKERPGSWQSRKGQSLPKKGAAEAGSSEKAPRVVGRVWLAPEGIFQGIHPAVIYPQAGNAALGLDIASGSPGRGRQRLGRGKGGGQRKSGLRGLTMMVLIQLPHFLQSRHFTKTRLLSSVELYDRYDI